MALEWWPCLSEYLLLDVGMEAVRSEDDSVLCANLEVEKEPELILGPGDRIRSGLLSETLQCLQRNSAHHSFSTGQVGSP